MQKKKIYSMQQRRQPGSSWIGGPIPGQPVPPFLPSAYTGTQEPNQVTVSLMCLTTYSSRLTIPYRYGADLVYTEEMVDKRVVASVRQVNERLGTVDFLDKGGAEGGRVGSCQGVLPGGRRSPLQLGAAAWHAAHTARDVWWPC